MKNRFRIPPRRLLLCLAFGWVFACSGLSAQTFAFTFSYPGPNLIAVDADCSAPLAGNIGTPVVNSTIGATITESQLDETASGFTLNDAFPPGTTLLVWWRVSDNQGHTQLYSFTISFADLSAPVFDVSAAPTPLLVNSILQVPPAPALPVQDNCTATANLVQTFTQTTAPGLCQGGSFTRTWTATDEVGNTATYTQYITVYQDTLPPQVLFSPQNGSSNCAVLPTAYPAWLAQQMANFQASDASGIAAYTNNSPLPYPMGCAQNRTVTFRATDACGLYTTRSATFFTSDTQNPVVNEEPHDTVVHCAANGSHWTVLGNWIHNHGFAVVHDACTPDADLVYKTYVNSALTDSTGIVDSLIASFANGCGFHLIGSQTYSKIRGKVRVEIFAEDACGPSHTTFVGQATFALRDTLPPLLNGITATEQCGGASDSLALKTWIDQHGYGALSDGCSTPTWTSAFSWLTSTGQTGSGTIGSGPYPVIPAHNCNWHVDVTFHNTDDCGNAGQGVLRFQVRDTIKPVFSNYALTDTIFCPQPLPTVFAGTVTDNCDNNLTLSRSVAYADTTCAGNYAALLTWKATDDCGNTATALQTIFVRDTVRPVFTLVPPNVTVDCAAFVMPPPPVFGSQINAADNCGQLDTITMQVISTQNPNPAVCGHYTFTVTRIFTALDQCGNFTNTAQIISVEDHTPPAFFGFADTTTVCEVQPMMPPPTAADACSGPTAAPTMTGQIINAGPCADTYTLTLTWTAKDVCNNVGLFSQDIHVVDTVAPVLLGVPADASADCENIPAVPNNITADDSCDETPVIAFQETEIRDPDPTHCAHWANYTIRREWTATDNCGNSRTYTQNLNVQDNTPPVLLLQDTVLLPSMPGFCGADVVIPTPLSVYDVCTSQTSSLVLKDTVALTPSGPSLDTSPVNIVVFQWWAPNMPPNNPVVGNATLKIFLDKADSETPTETFQIVGENNTPLGTTNLTNTQCGNSMTSVSITALQLNSWLTDGELEIRLIPNGSGDEACNAFCFGQARAELTYDKASPQVPVTITYSVDGGAAQNYPPPTASFLNTGSHTITYTATDCAGNASTASMVVRVDDIEPPVLTAPAPLTAYVAPNGCTATVTLPFPGISDNCGFSGNIQQMSVLTPVTFLFNPNAGWVPKTATLDIPGLLPNAVTGGILKILHKGDNGDKGEFFNVYDENNAFLSVTDTSITGECTVAHASTIAVTAGQINNWATDGVAKIKLIANTNVVTYTDFINPCGSLNAANQDGISEYQAMLSYNYPIVDYDIRASNNPGVIVASGHLTGSLSTATLGPGVYTVTYKTHDASGTSGSTSFQLTVRDTIKPTAVCMPTTIFVNPSGVVNYTLTAQEINGGSVDNCSGSNLSFQVSPGTFTCNQAAPPNNFLPVTLTVTDTSGNSKTCQALVNIQTASFQPTVSAGICQGGSVQFAANPPAAPGNVVYTYSWAAPSGTIFSMAQNPLLLNASEEGNYRVTITGITGCTSVGIVNLNLVDLPTVPPLSTPTSPLCAGSDLILITNPYGGTNVNYAWYSGTPANGVLLGTTTFPQFTVTAPTQGQKQYFVKITADGCTSPASAVLNLMVTQTPPAVPEQDQYSPCEGETLILGTAASGLQYHWTGPGGFSDTSQYPLVTTSVVAALHGGTYTLVVSKNGCQSAPAFVQVTPKVKPPTPQLAGTTNVCLGDTVQLISNVLGAQYFWTSPNFTTITTSINTLLIPNVMHADSGQWRVQVLQAGCLSDNSAPLVVKVQDYPQVSITANTKICQGAALDLLAVSNPAGVTFAWTGPGNFSKVGAHVMDPEAKTGDYIVVATTSFGCSGTAVAAVTVVTPPQITSMTHTAPPCVNGMTSATLQASVFSQNPPLTYMWSGPNGFNSTLPNPTIPTVSSDDNGPYTLTVKDSFGCISELHTLELDVQDIPVAPLLLPAAQAVCTGATVTLQITNANQYNGGPSFIWTTPSGDTVTTVPTLVISNAQAFDAGDYSVKVETAACGSAQSITAHLDVNPAPNQPAISATPNPACAGDVIQFSSVGNPAGAEYFWEGPPGSGFPSGAPAPTLAATLGISGKYTLKIRVNGCFSPVSDSLSLLVNPRPAKPTAIATGSICLDQANQLLKLQVSPPTATPGAQYQWFNGATDDPLGPPSFSLIFDLTDFSAFSAGTSQFYVIASLGNCFSDKSNYVSATFDEIPNNTANAGQDFIACLGQPIHLNATAPTAGTGMWVQTSGQVLSVANPNDPATVINGLSTGNSYTFEWRLSNGACKNYSTDAVQVTAAVQELAHACADFDTCFADVLQLCATSALTGNGYWTQPDGQTGLGIVIVEPGNPFTQVTGVQSGNLYLFFWNVNSPGCGVSTDTVFVHNFQTIANAGPDEKVCETSNCHDLHASALMPNETGIWTTADPGITFTSPTMPVTTACGLHIGNNIFYWTTNGGKCGNFSRDTVVITYAVAPVVEADDYTITFGTLTELNVLLNDPVLPPAGQYGVDVLIPPAHGQFEVIDKGIFNYTPDITFAGMDMLQYRVCNLDCNACDSATVILRVSGAEGCEIPTIITPNYDLINDLFFIPCLGESVPEGEVTIFNQWGDEVFHAKPYLNDWQGTYNGEPLPSGTYYFVVRINAVEKPRTGFVIIQR